MIGNKLDLEDQREIFAEEAKQLASVYKINYEEVSAKTGDNVQQLFKQIGEIIYKKHQQSKSHLSNTQVQPDESTLAN